MIIAIDFDGTIVEHMFPEIGPEVPGAFKWIRRFIQARNKSLKLMLWTMRHDSESVGPVLTQAVDFCRKFGGFEFDYINENPTQKDWSLSNKQYANIYIDDAAACCPLIESKRVGGRPMVDWSIVGPSVYKQLLAAKLLI